MSARADEMMDDLNKTEERSMQIIEKIFAAAQPGAVFGAPVVSGEYTVITANEVGAGGGIGYGKGGGSAPQGDESKTVEGSASQNKAPSSGFGVGGGGGGGSGGRPVAVIVIGPNGVEVKPIIDATKLGLAGITTWVAMLGTLRKLFK